jgi:hypothetical protein
MKGSISFFDILGYRNFLENNSAIETAEQVLKFIASAGDETSSDLRKNFGDNKENTRQVLDEVRKNCNWIVFSDTIIHTVQNEFRTERGPLFRGPLLLEALASAVVLQSKMFVYGLPTRGVLHFGEYLSHENCLAGRALVEAYGLLEKVDFAGVIISNEFMAELNAFSAVDNGQLMKYIGKNLVEYLVPFSDGTERKMWILNFTADVWNDEPMKSVDISQLVHEKFWTFGKTISIKVDRKVQNTEKLLRYFCFLDKANH